MEDLLDEYLERDALSRVSVRAEGADPGADRLAAVHRPGNRRVFAARHITEPAPAPFDPHCIRVVGIVGLANEFEPVADAQFGKQTRRFVVAKTRERRTLDEQPHLLRLDARRCRCKQRSSQGSSGFMPN